MDRVARLLVVDVGNTNLSFGVFEGATLLQHVRCESARSRTADGPRDPARRAGMARSAR
jgi:hypothetical protein